MNRTVKIGIVGCGNISDAYFQGLQRYELLQVLGCSDLDYSRAEAKGRQFGIKPFPSIDELFDDPKIELVINLTPPPFHTEINLRALDSGKHVYCEKPFALDANSGAKVLAQAKEKKLLVGSAPDTFFGGPLQSARKTIDEGTIGRPIAALAFMMGRGHEHWHPSPEFYYRKGGGPMFDMGPYYLTALVNLLGPVRRVSGSTSVGFEERVISSQPLEGKKIVVETPTHLTGTLDFVAGGTATIVMSFDTVALPLPRIAIFGSRGTLELPDPNLFDGFLRMRDQAVPGEVELALSHLGERARGVGVADMAYSIRRRDRGFRASGELANHVVEIMESFEKSSATGRHITLRTTCGRPAMLPIGLKANELDA